MALVLCFCLLVQLSTSSPALPLGQQTVALPVQEIAGFVSPEDFFSDYVIPGKPVIFRGAATNFPAYKNWDDQYFLARKESYDWEVAYELGKKETRKGGQDPVPFADFIKRYKDEDLYCVTGLPKYLRDDLPIYKPLHCSFILENLMDDLVMWFSSGGTRSVWHLDDYENMNCLIRGRKELILADRAGLENSHMLDDESFSDVDVDAVDLERFPGFRDMRFYNASLNAGDCVYIPSYWQHTVRSWDRNIAVNAWWELYKTPLDCSSPAPGTTWDDVSMITDSDIGSGEKAEYKETDGQRGIASELRTQLYVTTDMRKYGKISRGILADFLESFLMEDEEKDPDAHTHRELFDVLDRDKSGYIEPIEVDLITDETVKHLESLLDRPRGHPEL